MSDLYDYMLVNLFSLLTRVVNYDYLNLEGSDLFFRVSSTEVIASNGRRSQNTEGMGAD